MTAALKKMRLRRRHRLFARFSLETGYRVRLDYVFSAGDFREFDRLVFAEAAKVLGGRGYSHGSGAWVGGDRDHDWDVKDKVTAFKLARQIARLLKREPVMKGRVSVYSPPAVVFDADPSLVKKWRKTRVAARLAG